MSLIHWWPLTEDFNDKIGTNNLTNTGVTFTSSGKIGQAALFDNDNDILRANNLAELSALQQYSISCWVYLSSTATNHSSAFLSSGDWNTPEEQVCFGVYSYNSGYTVLLVPNGSGWSTGINISSNKILLNQWYHVTITYNGSKTDAYINGNHVGSYAGGGINSNTVGYYYLGSATYYRGFTMKGRLNDVRIYNHTLSKKEVKELSKGLVCHYTFEEPGLTPNIFDTTIFLKDTANRCTVVPYGGNGFTMTSTGSDPYIGTSVQNGGGIGSYSTWYVGSSVTQVCLSWRHVSGPELDKSYMTFLNSSGQALNATHNNFGTSIISNGSQRYVLQTLPTGTVKVHVRFGNQSLASGSSITVDNICLKIGNNPLYSLPNLTYTPYNSVGGIIKSTTNQGIYTSSDAGVGKQSLECKGGTLITTPITGDITQGVTISCWVKGSVPTDSRVVFADYNSKLAFGFYNNGQAIITCAGYGHKCVSDIKTPWTSNWNHIVVRRDSTGVVQCFVNNNNLTLNGSQEWTHSENTFSIGGRYSGGWTSYFNGLVDDVRVYHTALSNDDIQELYKTRWAANQQGQVFSNALNERQSKFQTTRSGIMNCNIAYELGNIPDGYLALDGIKMERVPWINTGVIFNNANTQIMVAADVTPTATSGNNCLAGCGNSDWTGPVMLNFCGGRLEFGTNGYSTSSEAQGAYAANERLVVHAVIDYNSQKWFKNGVQIKNITSRTCPTTTAPLYIGTFKTPSSSVGDGNSFRGYIHYFEVKYGSIHKKFIPCKRLADSVLGMYEINEGIFYSPEGGTYTAGKSTVSLGRDGSVYCAEFNEI